MAMKNFVAEITANSQVADGFFEMGFEWDGELAPPKAGQFLTVRVSDDSVPLLRRPFALASFDEAKKIASIIYQVRGRGTEILSAKKVGDTIDVIASLGNFFEIDNVKRAVVVAGGVGVGPMIFLASQLIAKNVNVDFIFGSKNNKYIPNCQAFENVNPKICTDDGSAGFAGNVVAYIEKNIALGLGGDNYDSHDNHDSHDDHKETVIYSCGPNIMMKNLYAHAKEKFTGAKVFVSLEEIMACGVGACMGCVVPTINGYARVCKEGAVFNAEEIQWERM